MKLIDLIAAIGGDPESEDKIQIGVHLWTYYGNVNEEKGLWVGEKKDVTDMAIAAVFEWFMNQMDEKEEFAISYPNVSEFTLKMVREER